MKFIIYSDEGHELGSTHRESLSAGSQWASALSISGDTVVVQDGIRDCRGRWFPTETIDEWRIE